MNYEQLSKIVAQVDDVVCSITGLCIASSGVLGQIDPATGELYTGSALTIMAFRSVLSPLGGWLVTIGITLFAFSTIIGWEYHGEVARDMKAFQRIIREESGKA